MPRAFFRQQAQPFGQQFDAVAGAGVDRHGHLADPFLAQHAHEKGEHYHRQVVYAVIPGIFAEMQGDRFAGAGEAANENEFHHPEHNEGGVHNQPAA